MAWQSEGICSNVSVRLKTAALSLSLLTRHLEGSFTLHGSIQDAGAISPPPLFSQLFRLLRVIPLGL